MKKKNNELITFSTKKISEKESFEGLSVWQTKEKFVEAIKTTKKKLLIESPWIKKATLQYISYIEDALKRGAKIIILFGIETNDEHDASTLDKLKSLKQKYNDLLHLIHLPTHFSKIGERTLSGSHRKLIVKDEDYYLQGSFNFLSFNKREGDKVANESSFVVTTNIAQKWKAIWKEYRLNNTILDTLNSQK